MSFFGPPVRIDWVDCAKGFCIILVVMMHSTLGVENALAQTGWMGLVVAWAEPFRIPAFFLVAGLFVASSLSRGWLDFIDRKVVHFAYFYVVWVTIQIGFKAPAIADDVGWPGAIAVYLDAFLNPFGTLWFIYILPIFFVVTKLLAGVPVALVFLAAAMLEIVHIRLDVLLIDEFATRYVYFVAGYAFAPWVFKWAAWVRARMIPTMAGLTVWACLNGLFVSLGFSDLPFASLAMGFAGAAALVGLAAIVSETRLANPLRYCGQHSIVIYLGFFLPMATTRLVLTKSGILTDVGTISLIVTIASVFGALLMYWLARPTALNALYRRPDWLHLPALRKRSVTPAE